ncbi:MAG TPA: TIGR01777 family oxidoreductase [Solirubrobacteraceae bacterium]|jgi:hypothetical protein
MRVAVTGASGLIGSRLTAALRARGDEAVAVPRGAAAPACDAVVHLAGAPIAQRWTASAKREIRASRDEGTARLVDSLRAAPPKVLVSASAVGYYGPRGDERLDEHAPAGDDFLAEVCRAWEAAARGAEALGVRVAIVRTGVVLDRAGGALAKMLPFFRLGIGGPVAGGRQYVSWIALDDLVSLYLAALDGEDWTGPFNASAPEPVTNKELSRALGRALRRPAMLPVPGLAVRALYGEMATVVTTGQRAIPARPLELGFQYRHADLDAALRAALER